MATRTKFSVTDDKGKEHVAYNLADLAPIIAAKHAVVVYATEQVVSETWVLEFKTSAGVYKGLEFEMAAGDTIPNAVHNVVYKLLKSLYGTLSHFAFRKKQ